MCLQVAAPQVDIGKKKDAYVPSGAVGCREGGVDVGIGTDLDMRTDVQIRDISLVGGGCGVFTNVTCCSSIEL
jgi:hypothetical protein